jgi:hypothetical protein
MEYATEMESCGMIHMPSFMTIDIGIQAILRFCLRNLRGCKVDTADERDLRCMALRWLRMA